MVSVMFDNSQSAKSVSITARSFKEAASCFQRNDAYTGEPRSAGYLNLPLWYNIIYTENGIY